MLLGLGKTAALDAAKQWAKEWLTDKARVTRAIQKTAKAFSTKLPGAKDALGVWVETDAFRASMAHMIAGTELPEQLANADEFMGVTGLGFGAASPDVVRDLLTSFLKNIRDDLVSGRQGLILVDARVGEVLRQVQEVRADLAAQAVMAVRTPTEFLEQIAYTQGWGGGLSYGAKVHVNVELPPAVHNLAKRAAAVQSIREILDHAAWYAMYGGSGSGKTQLAILTAHEFVGRKIWIRLRGTPSTAALILETALTTLAPREPVQSMQDWCHTVCVALGPNALIVLDDVPRTLGDASLDEHLAAICAACAHTAVRLVTTSSSPLAPSTRAAVENMVREDAVADFDDQDVSDLFRAYGAPDRFLASAWFGFVLGATRRHPVILAEAARYLKDRAWATDDRSFDDLVGGTFASSLDLPTVEQIRQTVPEAATREFLYRLKVIGWPFGVEEVQRISAVPPAVLLPLEHLAKVVGLWVQQESDREYVISPLLARLTDDNLATELQQRIHLTLARGILEKRRLGPLQASQAINHFIAGGQTENAADVVLVAWYAMLGRPDLRDPFGLTSIWAGMRLPDAVDLKKRLFLRALQVTLRRRLGHDEQYERADLERLMTEGESNDDCQTAIALVGAILATYRGDPDPAWTIGLLARSLKAFRHAAPEIARDEDLRLHEILFGFLWVIAAWIKSDEQYEQWFAIVRELTPDEVQQCRAIPVISQASETICGGVWIRTADLPADERNWVGVLEKLELLGTWARSVGFSSLAASAQRSRIIVLAEYLQELPTADALASEAMEEFRDLPESRFSIADTIARQHYYFGSAADAVRWFGVAFTLQETGKFTLSARSLTLAGVAASGLDLDLARRYLQHAVASAAKGVDTLWSVTARGELGILVWNAGQHQQAYTSWSAAGQELITVRGDTSEWKTLFQLFGHCTGHFLGVERFKDQDSDGALPFSGILLRQIENLNELYKPELDWFLPLQMAMLAESVGAYDEALVWASRTTVGGGALATAGRATLAPFICARALTERRFGEIIRDTDIGDLDQAETQGFAQLDDESRAQRQARIAARLHLVALAIEIARIRLQDLAAEKELAQTAGELSRDCAARHGEGRIWSSAAEIFEALAHSDRSWRELWDKAVAAREEGNNALMGMYGIAATMVADPSQAVQIQLQIFPWVEQMFSPSLYHVTVAKFVPEYWRMALDRSPLSFGLLILTRRAVADANQLGDKASVHSILNAVALSLDVRVPDYVQGWLDEQLT